MSERKVALITGCARPTGIGRAVATRLAADHRVVVSDVTAGSGSGSAANRRADLSAVVREIADSGGEATAVVADVGDPDDVASLVDGILTRHGRLDVVVNNAAAAQGTFSVDVADLDLAEWDRIFAVNSRGTFLVCRAAVPALRRAGRGRIVNVSSIAGVVGTRGALAYSASKAAIIGLTKALALELAPSGVTVNAVCPGAIRTSRAFSAARQAAGEDVEAALAARVASIPVGRYGLPADVAATVAFLASDDAGYITGHALVVDGGETRA